MASGTSIHPRVVNGRTTHAKVNTSIPKKDKHQKEKLFRMIKHINENPNDAAAIKYANKYG